MQLRFFTIPVLDGERATEELNRFLTGHRILAVDRSFVQDGPNSAWALCVSYDAPTDRPPPGKRGKIDYREVLSEQDFAVFARLRSLRKELADKEGIPAYALFTNEQLAEMVQRRVRSLDDLQEINGVGEARARKYGQPFLHLLIEASPTPLPEPSGEA